MSKTSSCSCFSRPWAPQMVRPGKQLRVPSGKTRTSTHVADLARAAVAPAADAVVVVDDAGVVAAASAAADMTVGRIPRAAGAAAGDGSAGPAAAWPGTSCPMHAAVEPRWCWLAMRSGCVCISTGGAEKRPQGTARLERASESSCRRWSWVQTPGTHSSLMRCVADRQDVMAQTPASWTRGAPARMVRLRRSLLRRGCLCGIRLVVRRWLINLRFATGPAAAPERRSAVAVC